MSIIQCFIILIARIPDYIVSIYKIGITSNLYNLDDYINVFGRLASLQNMSQILTNFFFIIYILLSIFFNKNIKIELKKQKSKKWFSKNSLTKIG